MKASPLLRAWLQRLQSKGVTFQTKWRWTEWNDKTFTFQTPDGPHAITPKTCVLALGGASWSRLGSDSAWAQIFTVRGIDVTPFQPSNMGITLDWSAHMATHFGHPLKNITLTTPTKSQRGEAMISKRGLEGSLIYNFSAAFRASEPATMDLIPDQSTAQISAKLAKQSAKSSLTNTLRKALRLDPAKIALFMEFARHTPRTATATTLKAVPIPYTGTAPLDTAISVAGGVPFSELTETLMLEKAPGTFCAGEMLNWEAPTGGYLITGCLATGRTAGLAAANYVTSGCE